MTMRINPPFDARRARARVQAVEDAWNRRDPERVVLTCSEQSAWRHRGEFLVGRDAIRAFLCDAWPTEIHYRLTHELWAYTDNRIAVRFECEWQHATNGRWYRTHGNENWEFNEDGLMRRRDMSANDIAIESEHRRIGVAFT